MSTIREPRPMKLPKTIDLRIEVTQCPDCKHPEPGRHHYPCPPEMEAAMSREGKWTPGPWTVRDTGRVWSVHSSSTHRPLVTIDRDMGNSIAEANARLIAVAPQMAEALRSLLEALPDEQTLRLSSNADKARAALRAAGVE